MSMSFDRDLTEGQQSILKKFLEDKDVVVTAQDERNALFEAFEMKQREMTELANDLEQPVAVEIHGEGEIKTMADGTKYKATSEGWVKQDMETYTMPIQPIEEMRFVPNRIVVRLLELAPIDLNDIARMDFSDQERIQLAQLIGYSLSGFGELSYVDGETYDAANNIAEGGMSEIEARNTALRAQIRQAKEGVKILFHGLFSSHNELDE